MEKDIKYSYDDICIVPETISYINSRSECEIFDENGYLPIFTAPMNTVVNKKNILSFLNNKINVIIPRTIDIEERFRLGYIYNIFIALSMNEAIDLVNGLLSPIISKYKKDNSKLKICVDIADGHMNKYIEVLRNLKQIYGNNIVLMGGNIANPNAYKIYNDIGCDYVRCGIGGGDGCLTSSNTGVHYPYFSLIEEIYKIKKEINGSCKIIADGNIRKYRDIQKALIFADYVMIGSVFNKSLESAGKTTYGKCYWVIRGFKIFRPIKTLLLYGKEVNVFSKKIHDDWKSGRIVLWKQFYGMSTKIAQKAMNSKKLKTSEGLLKYQKVEYTLNGWCENEKDYLRSAMSYTNSKTLDEYKDSPYVTMIKMRFND